MNSLRPGRARRALTPLPPIDEEDRPPDQYTYPLDPTVPAYRNHLHRPPRRATDDNDEARESSPELLVLIPVHKQRRGPTPERHIPPPVFCTPRIPGIAADNLNHKHPQFPEKLDRTMKERYVEIPTSTFEEKLLPGKNLTPRQLKDIGKLKYDARGREHDMYPVLVSCGVDNLLLPDVLYYCAGQAVQRCCGCHACAHGLQGRRALEGEREH